MLFQYPRSELSVYDEVMNESMGVDMHHACFHRYFVVIAICDCIFDVEVLRLFRSTVRSVKIVTNIYRLTSLASSISEHVEFPKKLIKLEHSKYSGLGLERPSLRQLTSFVRPNFEMSRVHYSPNKVS